MKNQTTETPRLGEKSGDRVIGRSGDRNQNLTAEMRRHAEARDLCSQVQHRCERQTRQVSGHDFSRAVSLCEWALAPAILSSVQPVCSNANHAVVGNASWKRRWYHALRILGATLQEIFDENAYERFLGRTQASRSIESYRAFLRENEVAVARKPKCC